MGSEVQGRPRLTPKGERTRARIVAAAARLIYERGVAGTTLDDVKTAAEVSGSQMYHYFPDKDELVQAVITHQADVIAGNQRQADLGSAEGLQAWRDMVIARARTTEGKGGCPSARSPGSSRRPTRAPAPCWPADSGSGRPPSATGCAACATPGASWTAPTRTTSPSPSSPRSRAAFSSPRSSETPARSRRRSGHSSNLPAAALKGRGYAARAAR
jgi:AcrR family transcriptional regulator